MSKKIIIIKIIFTILIVIFSAAFSIYTLKELWERKKPNSNLVNKYTEDAGTINFSIDDFNNYYLFTHRFGDDYLFDQSYITVEGILYSLSGEVIGMYYYDQCEWDLHGKTFKKFKQVKKEIFSYGYCIKSFLNKTSGERIVLSKDNESTFPWPQVKYGVESTKPEKLRNIYFTQIKKCSNSTSQVVCQPQDVIDKKIFSGYTYSFTFIDNTFDITKNKGFIEKVINKVAGELSPYVNVKNNINLNPSTIKSDDGLILEHFQIFKSYYMYQNVKLSTEINSSVLSEVNFFLKNQETVYIRTYIKAQSMLAGIGGFFNFIYYTSFILNFFSNQYQTMYNTIKLISKLNYNLNENLEDNNKNDINTKNDNYNKYVNTSNHLNNDNNQVKQQDSQNKNLQNQNFSLRKIKEHSSLSFSFFTKHKIKYSYCHHIFFLCYRNSNPLYQKVLSLRTNIMSEETIFRNYFNIIKIKKFLLISPEKSNAFLNISAFDEDNYQNYHIQDHITKNNIEENNNEKITENSNAKIIFRTNNFLKSTKK